MSTKVVLPRTMHVGKDSIEKVAEAMKALNASKPLIITDKIMVSLGYIDKIDAILSKNNYHAAVFSDTVPEPTASSITAGVTIVQEGDFDCIIAVGGGSPIDSAKAIGIVGKFGGKARDYKFPRDVTEQGLPIIAIPTTAGTGSEATRFTIITDDASDEKMLLSGDGFMPHTAIIDYNLTLSLPTRTTADCGLDALTHAIESYVSKKANPFSDHQALAAIRLIAPNLRNVYRNPKDEDGREALMLGSTLAGIAFSNASVALIHGMSRPIGAFFHVPHGLSNAMLLPVITEFSIENAQARYADCARAMGVSNIQDSNSVACNKLVTELRSLNKDLEVPSMEKYGIDSDRFHDLLPIMAEQALASGSPSNNPRVPSVDEMIKLYKKVWLDK
ncbi:alcohol dehydrogenase [Vibrio sp. MACH09]|uniref:iron-containing alcohol dehydrogenase n=1 Tax=unclassified Vibrio TaxID=2614977 RepID=UPI001493979C|nr:MULTISPECIES: iron-containing alcohol dehydrogenase [unclassified Vibrio]NOI67149.1 iron-containing alcohol dehydrogenase [Vibrio sp. 99-8-1]GLO63485.1 alcohol dehydrogenase [Vibrio sp. MACH09]